MYVIFALTLFIAVGCNNPKPTGNAGTHATTPATGATPGTSVAQTRAHGTTKTVDISQVDNSENTGETVHVFKYSGAIRCVPLVAIGLTEMEPQLTGLGIGVHSSYKAKDGKVYDEGCHSQTGEMNVYVIDKTHLQISESRAGFCECTPDNSRPGVCVPYVYASAPANGCRGIVTK